MGSASPANRSRRLSNEPSGEYYDYTQTMQPERPWLLPYHQSLVYLIMLATRDGSGKMDKLYLNFAQTLDAIRKVHHFTGGIPQIIYLIGWHHEGHDSKYPDWSEVNPHLKRDEDETALDSLRWLIREARQYNATVSLHLNMFDAYQDSPLWDMYVAKDIIAKDTEGQVIPGKAWGGMTSYQVSYTQEWKHGLAQKRIDDLIAMVPELVEGKTIHIDAFLGARPLDREAPISPLLGYTKEQECATQRKIYRYWRDRGIDVTSEWVTCFRTDRFVGLQAWCWHGGSSVEDLPDELYCTNVMEESRELWGDPEDPKHEAYPREFFLKVLPWYYRNHPDGGDLPAGAIDGTDICLPALWCEEPTIIAYSQTGCTGKTWALPADWQGHDRLRLSRITWEGPEPLGEGAITDGTVTLDINADEAVMLTRDV
jgi:hypothetical protein